MRYLLFGGEIYYTQGGANDLLGSSNDHGELVKKGKTLMDELDIGWWHVYDITLSVIIAGSEIQAHDDFEGLRVDSNGYVVRYND